MTELEQLILNALEEKAPSHDIDIVDVELVGSAKSTTVCVRIDHAQEDAPTITLDEIAEQGSWIEEILDELDPIPNSYVLEVSSPGMARPLRRPSDFVRFAHERVKLETVKGSPRRNYTGELLGLEDGKIVIECDSERFFIPLEELKRCTIQPTYDFSSKNEK